MFIATCLGFLFIGYKLTSGGSDLPQGQLNLQVAPSSATVLIDGKPAKNGEMMVDIGEHEIGITMLGFKSYETVVNITQATPAYVGVILSPDSEDTQDWFENHPADQELSQTISDRQVDSSSQDITTKYPIFSELPTVFGDGADGLINIDSEAAINDSGKPSIGIYAADPQKRQEAISWIINRDYTISDLDVVFYGARIPIGSEETE